MLFPIDPSSGVAIYDQVVRQTKFAIADGVLREGELVPSVRELARTLAINPNTVTRAYNQLRTEDVIENVRGTGLAVKKQAAERCRKDRMDIAVSEIRESLKSAVRSRLPIEAIQQIVESELNLIQQETEQ